MLVIWDYENMCKSENFWRVFFIYVGSIISLHHIYERLKKLGNLSGNESPAILTC